VQTGGYTYGGGFVVKSVYVETTIVSYFTARLMNDPIVSEVRRHRMEHTRKFGGDLKLICEDLRRIQRESGYQVVHRSPKLLPPVGESLGGLQATSQS
jgi:hypothetical protein